MTSSADAPDINQKGAPRGRRTSRHERGPGRDSARRRASTLRRGRRASRERRRVDVARFCYFEAWLEARATLSRSIPGVASFPGDFFSAARAVCSDIPRHVPGQVGTGSHGTSGSPRLVGVRKPRLGEWTFLLGARRHAHWRSPTREVDGERMFLITAPARPGALAEPAIALALDEPGSRSAPSMKHGYACSSARHEPGGRPKATFMPAMARCGSPVSGRQTGTTSAREFLAHRLAERQIRVPSPADDAGGEHHMFAVQRFDREGDRRRSTHGHDPGRAERRGAASHPDIAQAPRTMAIRRRSRLTRGLYRGPLNVLVGNRDDHLRNHGFAGPARMAPGTRVR
jgi:hypothetical protein